MQGIHFVAFTEQTRFGAFTEQTRFWKKNNLQNMIDLILFLTKKLRTATGKGPKNMNEEGLLNLNE